jgi:4-carboxymuconolactone decarboxylase
MSRFQILAREQMTERQREVADTIASGPRGSLRGPFLALIHNPELASHVQALGEHLRYGTGLDAALLEVPILVVARKWNCDYEWAAHSRVARSAGLRDEVIDAIGRGAKADCMTADETLLYEFAEETARQGSPSDRLFEAAAQRFGRPTVLDLLAVCGYYSLMAFVLNAAQLPLPEGMTPLPERV